MSEPVEPTTSEATVAGANEAIESPEDRPPAIGGAKDAQDVLVDAEVRGDIPIER